MPATIFNSYGLPVGHISTGRTPFFDREQEEEIDRFGSALFFFLVILFLLFLLIISSNLPLWLRVFIHPQVIKLHIRRTKIPIGIGLILIALWFFFGFIGWHDYSLGFFSKVGLFLIAFGSITLLIGWGQYFLSSKYSNICDKGNGYGILNLHCVATGFKPSHILTWLQDGFFVFLYFLAILALQPQDRLLGILILGIPLLTVFGYTWYCQYKFSDGSKIAFC
jgi:hypothetical protein